ncbi:hypothetical protein [Brachybacterium sp. P6-10-X1]|uniref:hypothetical protein n=1 Tax=Brachybacterium sp. P6-10-X1 TaxID=1903186 RepID=UPI0012F7090F|nr:hypothetical protein [Brachybacterium sp. P6-10-X1]
MMRTIKKALTAAATLAAAGTLITVGAPVASAYNTLVNDFTNAEVNEVLRNNGEVKGYTCGWMPWPFSNLCESMVDRGANGGMIPVFENASDRGCGVRQTVNATGSGNSYDKADFSYELIDCP